MADYEWLHEIIERHARSLPPPPPCTRITAGRRHRNCHNQVCGVGGYQKRRHFQARIRQAAHSYRRKGEKDRILCGYPGRAHDSPVFLEMIKKVPDGAGCMMLDAGYDANENYRMIRNTGRRPVICTRKNRVVKGFCPRAEMLR